MKRLPVKTKFFICLLICSPPALNAQSYATDSAFVQSGKKNLVELYHKQVANEAHLYNGKQYETHFYSFLESHPYFLTNGFTRGDVGYNGAVYSNVPIKYDLTRDELVLLSHDSVSLISLNKYLVDSFSIAGHNFFQVKAKNTNSTLTAGFYEVLYNGKVGLVERHTKNVSDVIEQQSVYSRAFAKNFYYLYKDGSYHAVNNKKSFLKLLGNKKAALLRYQKANKLNFKHNKEVMMQKLVAYYDQLTN